MRKEPREDDNDKKRGNFQRRCICIASNEGRLHDERALYRAQPTTHPLLGGDTISPALRWAKDTVVDVGEGPDGRIGSRSSGYGTKLVSDDHVSKVVHVEIVLIVAEGVLDFLTGN